MRKSPVHDQRLVLERDQDCRYYMNRHSWFSTSANLGRYRDCAIYHRQLGDKDNTLKWATKELEVEQYCLGTDDMYYFNESGLSAQAWFDGVDRRQDHTRVAKANLAKREERRRIKELRRADKKAWREVMLVERLEQFEGSEAL